jgi:hypothetical protein
VVIQSITSAPASIPVDFYFQTTRMNWTVNERFFYTADICEPNSVNPIYKNDKWTIYPNPFSEQAILWTDDGFRDATLTIFNHLGQKVKEIRAVSGQTVTLLRDNLPSGLYFIQLAEEGKPLSTKQLVIMDEGS